MHRRDFLHPRRLAQSAGQVLGAIDELNSAVAEVEPVGDASLLRLARRAMATSFEVVLPYGTPNALALGEAAFDLIDALEAQLTVYRDTSEVSRLNRTSPARSMSVEKGLFQLLQLAQRITRATDGAFDITAGALIKAWGFFKGPKQVPTEAERRHALARVGMHHVELLEADRAVRFDVPELEINLGAIGKGYALDRVAELLRSRWNLPSALLHGGHSSVYAVGTAPGDVRGWTVSVRHPWDPERYLALVRLRDRALGSSAATFQHLEYEGKKLGHVLDPRTGWPASGITSSTVVAPTAAEADALSTAFFVGGLDLARRYCDDHPTVGALLLPEGADAPVSLNLASDECSLLSAETSS
jgi:thiamine biosynthesis lipoprotein